MIRNDREYRQTLDRIADFTAQVEAMSRSLREQGFGDAEIDVATMATRSLLEELAWDRDFYDHLRAEGLAAVPDYPPDERGKALIAVRIAQGMSQKELAEALGVSPAAVSRDESNEYRGITQDRYARVLHALGVEEHVSGYQSRAPVVIHMPVLERQAASYSPEDVEKLIVGSHGAEG